MINTDADGAIAAELANGSNDMVAGDFSDASSMKGLTLGTGYLCGSCHTGAVAFPVNESGGVVYNGSGTAVTTVTGHRVMAMATSDWNNDGSYGVYYSAGYDDTVAGDHPPFGGPVAFNSVATAAASGCKSCHDAVMPDGTVAFPHSYLIDNAGTLEPANDKGIGTSYIWLTTAGDADDARTISAKTVSGNADMAAGAVDGLCLKCHVSGDRTSGVGETLLAARLP